MENIKVSFPLQYLRATPEGIERQQGQATLTLSVDHRVLYSAAEPGVGSREPRAGSATPSFFFGGGEEESGQLRGSEKQMRCKEASGGTTVFSILALLVPVSSPKTQPGLHLKGQLVHVKFLRMKKKKLKIPCPADMSWRRSPIKCCTATEPAQYACISIQCCLSYFASGRQPCRIERMRWSDVSCSPQPVPRTAQCHQPVCLSDLYYVATGKLSGSSNSVVDVEAARQQLA
ncbi:hypothetical protein VFPPC_15292 [Pochonia chlamydosporia 170]|uniref:Uncharacterized protein n=1 Tax=Pochonia chlamydosporia 170 TaxID=1380566 RepID=A0A179G699_METCM|nr:hypothetical protein VFPPC_15292 [Pochonia chlamydosporia 170]OAQ73354.1 hypothetical protein VFPPC_15292 [Pochonia chlamydosporia 170]